MVRQGHRKQKSTAVRLSKGAAWGTRLVGLALFVLLTTSCAFAGPEKIANDLQAVDPTSTVNVIVQFAHVPTDTDHQNVRNMGGALLRNLQSIKAGLYSLSASALPGLSNDPNVVYISPDRQVKGSYDYAPATVGANIAWQFGLNGTGIGVAVIDSGITDHPDLHDPATGASRVVYSESLIDSNTADLYGHGTHVAGIVASNGASSKGAFPGMASNVRLINLRVLDQSGSGTDGVIIAAIHRAIALRDTYNIRVINFSMGRPIFESYNLDPLCQAVEAAWKAGIVVVVAAGNNGRDNSYGNYGYRTITSPGNDPYVITVGAMKTADTPIVTDDTIASYSSKGPTLLDHIVKPDLVAPGNRLTSLRAPGSTLDLQYAGNRVTSTGSLAPAYFILSGTSMATPVVSGAVGLLLQNQPQLTPDQVKARLMKTASKTFPYSSSVTDPITLVTYTS